MTDARDLGMANTERREGEASALLPIVDWTGDRYETIELLGRGGMGEVSLSHDKRVGRDVAKKRMHAGQGVLETSRFLREATLQGRLEHPSIVPVYDLGREEDGPYFTMKRVRGDTLEQILARGLQEEAMGKTTLRAIAGKWSLRALLNAFVQVARAVHFAHVRGVVHRDLKPANIMLGEFGEVYVLDWGLAKSLPGSSTDLGALDEARASMPYAAAALGTTEAGAFLGTLGYMAPEQILDASGVDVRADVYALGAILFEIFACAPLHPRITAPQLVGATLDDVDIAQRLSDLGQMRATLPVVPPELVQLIQACVSVPREKRPADAGALAASLQLYLDGDRDLALRRNLAVAHREEAETLLKRATDPSRSQQDALQCRRDALREVGKALALDPSCDDALRTLISLLETPPTQMPREVEAALHQRETKNLAALAKRGAFSWLSAFLLVPLMAWMGMRHWEVIAVLGVISVIGAGLAMRGFTGVAKRGIPFPALVGGTLFISGISTIFGPLWLGPLTAVACMVPWLTVGAASQRRLVIGMAILGVALPSALVLLGVLPPPYEIIGGDLIVHPFLLDFTPAPTYAFLSCTSLFVMIIVAQFASAFRDEVDKASERVELLAWQLRQIVPEAKR